MSDHPYPCLYPQCSEHGHLPFISLDGPSKMSPSGPNKPPTSAEQAIKARKLKALGKSNADIALAFGCSERTVRRWLKVN